MRLWLAIFALLPSLAWGVGPDSLLAQIWSARGAVGYAWTTNDFVMTWAIPDTNAVTIPGRSGYVPNAQIYWRSTDAPLAVTAYNDADLTHSYAAAGTYQIIITNDWPALYFNNAGNKTLIKSVDSWGTGANWDSLDSAFYGCTALTNCVSPLPAMPNVTTLYRTWRDCTGLTAAPDVNALTNVTTLVDTWRGCSGIKTASDVNALTKVDSLYFTWQGCTSLSNAPAVSALTNVTTLRSAWNGCNKLTNAVSVNALTKVDTLQDAWYGCSAIKTASDVSALTNVTVMSGTWYNNAISNAPDVSTLTKVTTIASAWSTITSLKVAPAVSALTNVTTIASTWWNCTGLTNAVAVNTLTKLTAMDGAWYECTGITNSVQSILGDCLWITGQVKNVGSAFENCSKLSGNGMPLVSAITNSPLYPTGYTIANCFDDCTNLADWATIPADWK